MSDIIGYILIVVGILFNIFGCIGLVRFPDVYNRLQASTKCVTLGTIMLLVGVAVVDASGVELWEGTIVDKYAEEKQN